VLWADNQADELSKLGSTRAEIPHGVFIQDLVKPYIKEKEKPMAEKPLADQLVTAVPTSGGDWREPFIWYLTSADVPHDKIELERASVSLGSSNFCDKSTAELGTRPTAELGTVVDSWSISQLSWNYFFLDPSTT
jgi:hypothetical protein